MDFHSNKLSPISVLHMSDVLSEGKCSLCLVAVLHSVECVEGVGGLEGFVFIGLGKVNVILLTE